MTDAPTPDDVVAALPAWLVLVVQFNESVAHRMGVSVSDLQALFALSRRGTSSPGDLGAEVGLTSGSASRMVDRLVAAGLATRRSSAADRRRVTVTATPAALARVAELYAPMNDRLRDRMAAMPAPALAELHAFVTDAGGLAAEAIRAAASR